MRHTIKNSQRHKTLQLILQGQTEGIISVGKNNTNIETGIVKHQTIYFGRHLTGTSLLI